MINKKATILGLSVSLTIATAGILLFSNNAGLHFEKATQADSTFYTAEISASNRLVPTNGQDTLAFRLHNGENYGHVAAKWTWTEHLDINPDENHAFTIKPDAYVNFFVHENGNTDKYKYKIDNKYTTLYAFPGIKSATVIIENNNNDFSVHGYSGASNCFNVTSKVEGNYKIITAVRNNNPLSSGTGWGYYLMLDNNSEDLSTNIVSVTITYSC